MDEETNPIVKIEADAILIDIKGEQTGPAEKIEEETNLIDKNGQQTDLIDKNGQQTDPISIIEEPMEEVLEQEDEEPYLEEVSVKTTYDALIQINSKIQNTLNLRQDNNKIALREMYDQLLPYILHLRRVNRCEKLDLEARQRKVRELNERLIDLQLTCNSLTYEVATMKSEVEGVDLKPKSVSLTDHKARMKALDEEERQRKDLREKLLKVGEETKSIEIACSQGEAQLDQLRPHIKQLLEKVTPTLQQIK